MNKIQVNVHQIKSGMPAKLLTTNYFKTCMVLNGGAYWEIGGVLYQVRKGDVILLGTGDKRVFREIPGSEMRLMAINCEPQFVFGTPFLPLFVNRPQNFTHVLNGVEGAQWLFYRIARENKERGPEFETAMASLMVLLLTAIKRHCVGLGLGFKATELSPKMYEVLGFINNHFDKEISLGAAAALIPMSKSSFSKYFSKCMGTGFARYVNQKRVELAVRMLEQTDETVLSIGLACGFNNIVSFYKAFSKATGCTPSEFRERRITTL